MQVKMQKQKIWKNEVQDAQSGSTREKAPEPHKSVKCKVVNLVYRQHRGVSLISPSALLSRGMIHHG